MGDKNVGVFFLSLSLSASKFLNGSDFDYFSFCDCNNMWGGGDRSNEEHLALSCIVGLAAVALADVVFA